MYKINIDSAAIQFLDNLDNYKYKHLIEEIFNLEKEPRPVGCVKLKYL